MWGLGVFGGGGGTIFGVLIQRESYCLGDLYLGSNPPHVGQRLEYSDPLKEKLESLHTVCFRLRVSP